MAEFQAGLPPTGDQKLHGPAAASAQTNPLEHRELQIRKPDDWHLHLRDGHLMEAVLPATARVFARALVMPNLDPPVITGRQAATYRQRIVSALPRHFMFTPLMTLYLTEDTDPFDVRKAIEHGIVTAVKLYPADSTTNSQRGVRNFDTIRGVVDVLSEFGVPLCIHGEVADFAIDVFDREAVFIERVLEPIQRSAPELKIVLEHVTTKEGVDYVLANGASTAATITAHHLLINRNHILAGGLRPHYYCLPVAKRERHRIELIKAATSGGSSFFLGTDSAPHFDRKKEAICGCAGIFSAPNALSCVAQVFDDIGALKHLESFVSINGAKFYGLDANQDSIRLEWQEEPIELSQPISYGTDKVTVFNPGIDLHWKVCSAVEA